MGMLMRRHYPKPEATEEPQAEGETTENRATGTPEGEVGSGDETTTEATEGQAEGETTETDPTAGVDEANTEAVAATEQPQAEGEASEADSDGGRKRRKS